MSPQGAVHFWPAELSWCPQCLRISISTEACLACANHCGIVSLSAILDREPAPQLAPPQAQPGQDACRRSGM